MPLLAKTFAPEWHSSPVYCDRDRDNGILELLAKLYVVSDKMFWEKVDATSIARPLREKLTYPTAKNFSQKTIFRIFLSTFIIILFSIFRARVYIYKDVYRHESTNYLQQYLVKILYS